METSYLEQNFPKVTEIYNTLSKKKNLKNLSFFLLLNLGFMFVEVIYGLVSNSLGLLTDGAHMLLDCTAVLIGLLSAYLSDFKGNTHYNFGYSRSELIGTFINSVFLFFIAIYIVFESIERFITPKEIEGDNLILVSFLGLLVNLVGIYFFHDINEGDEDGHHHHHHQATSEKQIKIGTESKRTINVDSEEHHHHHSHENDHEHHHSHEHGHHQNENLYAIYIHILADTLGSVAVLISSFLIRYLNLYISDPICSLSISFMILYSSTPVLKRAILSLLHYQDETILKKKEKIEEGIMNIQAGDKVSISIGHFDIWTLKKDYYIAEIKVTISIGGENKKEGESCHLNIISEIQNKIFSICKENKISEHFIDVSY